MCSYNKTQVSAYDPTKLSIYPVSRPEDDVISNCGQNFKKTVSLDDIEHLIDDENIVIYEDFDCGTTFYFVGWSNNCCFFCKIYFFCSPSWITLSEK